MSAHKCCGTITLAGLNFARSAPCSINAKFEHEGKHYCGTHYPPNVAKRRNAAAAAKANAKYLAEFHILRNKVVHAKQLRDSHAELLAALKALLPHVRVPGVPMGSEFSRPFPTPKYITNAHAAIKHAEELK